MAIRLGQTQQIKQIQTQKLNQQQIMAIKLMQMTRLELANHINDELEQNPTLELMDPDNPAENIDSADNNPIEEAPESEEPSISDEGELINEKLEDQVDIDWTEFFADDMPPRDDTVYGDGDEENSFENYVAKSTTLREHLSEQLLLGVEDELDKEIGEFLIGNISDDGYLEISVEEATKCLELPNGKILQILKIIRGFNPLGVGAFDLSDCLMIQYDALEEKNPVAQAIIKDHLEDLAANRIELISRKLEITTEEIARAVEIIRSLNPRPGHGFQGGNETQYIKPDVIVELIEGNYEVTLNRDIMPNLRYSPYYARMMRNKQMAKSPAGQFIRDKLNSSKWLINTIRQRNDTILLISRAIVDYQRDFLDFGTGHLKPLRLSDIAEKTDRSEATVSRVTRGKYMQTPRGIFELKFFFTGGLDNYSQMEQSSTEAIKKMIKDYIDTENNKKPFSDQAIVKHLRENGIDIARRTVTKYREAMNILSSTQRKSKF